MFIDEIKDESGNEKFLTNNPDEEMYTNNPDDEEDPNSKNNKLFFNDDEPEIKNQENKEIIAQNIPENNNNENNELINEEKKQNEVELKELDNNNEIKEEEKEPEKINEKVDEEVNESNEIIKNKLETEEEIIIKNKKKESLININESNQTSEKTEENNNSIIQTIINNNKKDNNIIIEEKKNNTCSKLKKILLAIFFGQFLSILGVSNGYFAEKIEKEKEIHIPLLINSSYYFLIFFLYFFISKCKIKKPKWIYIILSILDTQANFINIYIFSFIDFRYPYIINVLSTIWTVVFTLIIIRIYKYLLNHIIGIILCIVGVFAVFLGTFEKIDDFIEMFKSFNDDVKGLLLSILVSILYGLSTVLMEKYISTENDEIKSYCTWLGIFGLGISILESFIPKGGLGFEFKILFVTKIDSVDVYVIIYWIIAAISLAVLTALSPFYIQKFSATMYNISLTFTILWSFVIDIILIKKEFNYNWLIILYFVGFIIIIAGTIFFNLKERKKKHNILNNYA